MKDIKKQIAETGKKAVITASAIIGLSKVLAVILRVSQKNPEVIKKFFKVSGGLAAIAGSAVSLVYYAKNKSEASQYNSNRKADGDQYTVERMADSMLVKARGKASPYRESPHLMMPIMMEMRNSMKKRTVFLGLKYSSLSSRCRHYRLS